MKKCLSLLLAGAVTLSALGLFGCDEYPPKERGASGSTRSDTRSDVGQGGSIPQRAGTGSSQTTNTGLPGTGAAGQ